MQSVRFNCKTFLHLIVQPEEHHPGPLNDLIANDTGSLRRRGERPAQRGGRDLALAHGTGFRLAGIAGAASYKAISLHPRLPPLLTRIPPQSFLYDRLAAKGMFTGDDAVSASGDPVGTVDRDQSTGKFARSFRITVSE
jgi:hypothetical protein